MALVSVVMHLYFCPFLFIFIFFNSGIDRSEEMLDNTSIFYVFVLFLTRAEWKGLTLLNLVCDVCVCLFVLDLCFGLIL